MPLPGNAAPIALPTGGGALSGIGEKFKPDLHTGTGNFSIPIAVPGGRSGVQPDLQLLYGSGQGNGPFGLGWAMPVAGVSRKTSHGIPQYDDARDVFILSGAEDLVAIATTGAKTRYRPANRESLRAHRAASRRDQRLLGSHQLRRPGQRLRHQGETRRRSGGGRRPWRTRQGVRVAADGDRGPVRQSR